MFWVKIAIEVKKAVKTVPVTKSRQSVHTPNQVPKVTITSSWSGKGVGVSGRKREGEGEGVGGDRMRVEGEECKEERRRRRGVEGGEMGKGRRK